MYDLVVNLIGEVPEQYEFIYAIATVVFSNLIISFLFSLFYLPLNMIRGK